VFIRGYSYLKKQSQFIRLAFGGLHCGSPCEIVKDVISRGKFEKTNPILGGQNLCKYLYIKKLWRFLRFVAAEKQSRTNPIVVRLLAHLCKNPLLNVSLRLRKLSPYVLPG
jgi:hypothetical protein